MKKPVVKRQKLPRGIEAVLTVKEHYVKYVFRRKGITSLVIEVYFAEDVNVPTIGRTTIRKILRHAMKKTRRYATAPLYYLLFLALRINGFTKLLKGTTVYKNGEQLSTNSFLKQTYRFAKAMNWS